MSLTLRYMLPVATAGVVMLFVMAWLWAAERPYPEWVSTSAMLCLCAGFAVAGGLAFTMSKRMQARLERLPADLEQAIAEGTSRLASPEDLGPGLAPTFARLETIAQDMHKIMSSQDEMERMALSDPLTGLPNRRGLFKFVNELSGNDGAWRDLRNVGVMHVDLDHFKTINDTLGHDAGDYVLVEATKRMAAVIRDTDILARLGGDEFVVFAPGIQVPADIVGIAERIVAQFKTPIQYREHACMLGASVGVVLGGQRGSVADPSRLLINADLALCRAKNRGRNQYAVFDDTMAEEYRRKSEQSIEIREGLLTGAFEPWFQPMFDMSDGRVTGVELLSRWRHPTRGVLLPRDFLATAEAHNMIEEIGDQVLEAACKFVQRHALDGGMFPTLHVNMNRGQLVAPAMVDKISWILDDSSVPPERVAMEVSERLFTGRSVELVLANLRRLADLGIEIVLDDFGTETGAVRNILNTGARKIKCSGGLCAVSGSTGDDPADQMLRGILRYCAEADVTVVAKAVETPALIDRLAALGVRDMQGEALAPAMSAPDLADWLAQNRMADRALREA